MNRIISCLCLATVLSITSIAIAEEQDGQQRGRRNSAGRQNNAGRQNQQGNQGNRANRGPGGRQAKGQQAASAMQADPTRMAARMLQSFDKDGDQKLDARELAALLTELRQNRGALGRGGMNGGDGQRQRMDSARRDAGDQSRQKKGKRGLGDNAGAEAGGDKPKRPGA